MTSAMLETLVLDSASCARADSCEDIIRALRLGMQLAVADIVFDRELSARGGERLVGRGLRVERLADIRLAISVRREHPYLSLGDAFSVALVTAKGWTLLTSSPWLTRLAEARGIAVGDFRQLSDPSSFARTQPRVSDPRSGYGLVA